MSQKILRQLIRETLVLESRQPILLYHATCFPPESFTKGIDPKRAQGFGQGAGFYVFREKDQALQHARTLETKAQDTEFSKEIECPPAPDGKIKSYIVCIDTPITPKTFDIDYELYSAVYIDFLLQNQNRISPQTAKQIGIRKFLPKQNAVSFFLKEPSSNSWSTTVKGFKGWDEDSLDDDPGTNTKYAPTLALSALILSQLDPQLFDKFESRFLHSVGALKYNGNKPIIPHHIEDTQGNTIWSR